MNIGTSVELSESFTLSEFLRSQVAIRAGRVIEPTLEEMANLKRLCVLALQPIRNALGRPIVVTSGLRPAWLNTMIGGSQTSAHMDGRAADIVVPGMTPLAVCRAIEKIDLPLDQVILEGGSWAHVAIAKEDSVPRRQYLTARFTPGKVSYEVGIRV